MISERCRRSDALPVENSQGLINEYSYKPAAERAFVIELRNAARGGQEAPLHRVFSFLMLAEHTICNEIEHAAISGEQHVK
jgi:hypothetical protein